MSAPENNPNPVATPVLAELLKGPALFQALPEELMPELVESATADAPGPDDDQDELYDIRMAEKLTEHLLTDEGDPGAEFDRAVVTAERIDSRIRARRAREQGRKALEYRHAGGFGRTREITINETPIGYQFLRYFAGAENALYTLYRMGHRYMPKTGIDQVRSVIDSRLVTLEATVLDAETFANQQLAIHVDAHEYMPTYARPTVDKMTVHVRTRQADRFLDAILGFDRVLEKLHAVAWFGEIDETETRVWQDRFRSEMSDVGVLIALTAKGLRNQAEQKKAP